MVVLGWFGLTNREAVYVRSAGLSGCYTTTVYWGP